ncbi:sugar phosphate isomerase/epimerase [Paenibacillus cisolokensis]|uniref:sugar phosphate isomerase/epimerase family protein n=1 Tax=Paenibacillus cisolokensis TaxID=1658519 RepID=UPI003D265FE9
MNPLGFMSYVYDGHTADAMAESARAAGFSFVQLDPRQPLGIMDDEPLSPARAEKVRAAFERCGIEVVALSGYTNLVHPDPDKRTRKLEQFERMIDLCEAYGTRWIATETGSLHPTNSWRDCEDNRTDAAWEDLLAAVDRLRSRAAKRGAGLLLEGFVNNVLAEPDQAIRLVEALGSEGIAFVMDPFNYLKPGDMERQPEAFAHIFDCIGPRSPVAHAKDTVYGERGIVTPRAGAGDADWALYASMLAGRLPDVPLVLEHAKAGEVGECLAYIRNAFESASPMPD